jgi:8-oxo-dGTP pyrophosphatase MutT (NUDIX family)
MSSTEIFLLITVFALAIVIVARLIGTANRLDRLHIRTDAGWAALDAALARRAVVARAIAAAGCLGTEAARDLRAAADRAEQTPRAERDTAENELTRLLGALRRARLPDSLADELIDAQERVVIARRVHNDAVRDTIALRGRRIARWFKLAGTAPQPEYFEIVEPVLTSDGGGSTTPRVAARVILIDAGRRVLLFNGRDPVAQAEESWWFTVGGGVAAGEDLRVAALRELREETGIDLPPGQLVGPVWRRRAVFSFDRRTYDSEEWFFFADLASGGVMVPDTSRFDEHRWWSVEELRATQDTVYPMQLAELLPELLSSTWDGQVRAVR